MVFSDDFLHSLKIKNFFFLNSPKLYCGFKAIILLVKHKKQNKTKQNKTKQKQKVHVACVRKERNAMKSYEVLYKI